MEVHWSPYLIIYGNIVGYMSGGHHDLPRHPYGWLLVCLTDMPLPHMPPSPNVTRQHYCLDLFLQLKSEHDDQKDVTGGLGICQSAVAGLCSHSIRGVLHHAS